MATQVDWKFAKRPVEERKRLGLRHCQKYENAGKVPWSHDKLIIGKDTRSEDLLDLPEEEFLAPSTMKVGQLKTQINKQMQRDPSAPLYLYVNNDTILPDNAKLGETYQEYRANDYFLYIAYSENNIYSQPSV